jgi:hypothetical protein
MVLTAALPAIHGIGPRFFPTADHPETPTIHHGAGPIDLAGGVERGQEHRMHPLPDLMWCQSRRRRQQVMLEPQPVSGEASPRGCQTSIQRESRLVSPGSRLAACHPAVWAAPGISMEPAAPTVHRVRVVWPCTHDTPRRAKILMRPHNRSL